MPEQPGRELEISGTELADEIDDEKEDLPHKEEIVVEQIDPDPECEQTVPPVVNGFVQRPEHPRKERQNVDKVIEEDVVQAPARKGIEHRAQHGIVLVPDVAAQIEIRAAARHREFQDQQRSHQIGQPVLRKDQREPEKWRAVQVEGVGVHRAAAKVGGPREGVVDAARTIRIAQSLQKPVHVAVKADLLAVEVSSVVEESAVDEIERQENERRCQGTQADCEQELVLLLAQQPGRLVRKHVETSFLQE